MTTATTDDSRATYTVPVSLEVGRRYRFKGIKGKPKDGKETWKYPPSTYRLIGLAKAYRLCQELVVYVGVGGDHDEGKLYLANLTDWVDQFTLVED